MIVVSVRVHPGASRDELRLLADGTLDARLRARPVEGQANQALVRLLASRLQLRVRDVQIARGQRARQKVVAVALSSPEELEARLTAGGSGAGG